jgi:atlastin
VFLHGDNFAIVLIDTQGLFDPETSSEENAKILTLTTLLSSAMILNLNNVIQEDQLQYLQYATEFATFASSNNNSGSKPFQKFMLLIRDWQNVDDFELGLEGGRGYLEQVLQFKAGQSDELRSVREHLRGSFEELICCLMPYPGKKVASAKDYDGHWGAMDEDFLVELKSLVENFLKSEQICGKKVNGVTVSGGEFFEIIKGIVGTFSTSGLMPKASTLYELTVDKIMSQLVQRCFEIYENHLKGQQTSMHQLEVIHNQAEAAAMSEFDGAKKMGSQQDEEKFKNQLTERISKKELEWKMSWISPIIEIELEKLRKIKDEREAERIRQQKQDEVSRKIGGNIREIRKHQAELRMQRARIEEEQRRQKEAEEAIEREKQRQRELQLILQKFN